MSDQLDAESSLPDKAKHSQETSIQSAAGFEPAIPPSDRAQTHAFDRATTGIRLLPNTCTNNIISEFFSLKFIYLSLYF
jgi:hypothetical protein